MRLDSHNTLRSCLGDHHGQGPASAAQVNSVHCLPCGNVLCAQANVIQPFRPRYLSPMGAVIQRILRCNTTPLECTTFYYIVYCPLNCGLPLRFALSTALEMAPWYADRRDVSEVMENWV